MPLLHSDPQVEVHSLAELLGLALAMEEETQRRYAELAQLMERCGDETTAAAFRKLAEQQRRPIGELSAWAGDVTTVPTRRPRELPTDIARSWDELASSALTTPYRALAVAVAAAERAFAHYSYIAARADEPGVRRAAERLAGEKLNQAALLRHQRREAWRRERWDRPEASPPRTLEELDRRARRLLAEAAAAHAALAAAAAAGHDVAEAEMLRLLALAEAQQAGSSLPPPSVPVPFSLTAAERRRRALMPLERLSELFEAAAEHAPSEAVLAAAQVGLETTLERLRRVGSTA